MKVEAQSIKGSAFAQISNENVHEQFKALNVLFLALNTYINFNDLDRYGQNILEEIKGLQNYFSNLPIYEMQKTSSYTLSPKEKVIAAKTIDLLAEFIPSLEKFCINSTFNLKPYLKKAILELSLIKAFTFYPTVTQNDLIYLGQFSTHFSEQFSNEDLIFSAPSLDEVLKDPKAFAKQVETLAILVPSFQTLMPHIPQESPYKAELTACYQNLFNATFKAKLLLNQINYNQTDKIESSAKATLEAYEHFLKHIELPF